MAVSQSEAFKGGCHFLTAGMALTMGLYNALEWTTRRERHLVANIAVYGVLLAWETRQTYRHWAHDAR